SAFAGLLHAPDGSGTKLAAIIACHSGSLAEGEAALRPLKSFGSPLLDVIQPTSYEATNTMLDGGFPAGAPNYWKSSLLTELTDAATDAMITRFSTLPSPMSSLLIEHVHGAVTRVGVSETAFPHRSQGYNFLVVSEWDNPGDNARNIAWARASYDTLQPHYA